MRSTSKMGLIAAAFAITFSAAAQEATFRKALVEPMPRNPQFDELSPSAMPGIFEVRVNVVDQVEQRLLQTEI